MAPFQGFSHLLYKPGVFPRKIQVMIKHIPVSLWIAEEYRIFHKLYYEK